MSEEKQETVADIVAAKHHFREVAKMIPHEEVAVSKMETTTPNREKSSAVGNATVMREALENVRFYLPHFLQYMRIHYEDAEAGGYYEKILEVVNAALSAPPMNCDKYTLAEALRKYGFQTKSNPWGEKEWLDFCEWYISEAKGETDGSK